ncbi:class I SAM-dependent methyltransferase [Rhodopila sp.]|uniref:class I SAM-dependent methyltransferase n=1 Tax=Rhodopila sp. TaxID=2480087 RepID=UPI003D12B758
MPANLPPANHPPERLDAFMARANAIYYATQDPFADFTTAPEISQMFGEILGLWAAVTWQLLGAPTPVSLAEAGPGRGTLMADALRAVRRTAPDFAAALRVHLIETSPRLKAAQAAQVPGAAWHDDLATLPAQPTILLANEFLDALPIRQFVRRGSRWTERFVAAGQWVEQPVEPGLAPSLVPQGRAAAEGDIVELNESARRFVATFSQRAALNPAVALLLDYGPERSAAGDSLQALARKRPTDPLRAAGSADLTAHVDFADLTGVARDRGAAVQGPVPQGEFLTALGLFRRAERLARDHPGDDLAAPVAAARRLADPDAMGHLFKAMAIASPGCPPLPGFPPP